jgi:hypothetical protein
MSPSSPLSVKHSPNSISSCHVCVLFNALCSTSIALYSMVYATSSKVVCMIGSVKLLCSRRKKGSFIVKNKKAKENLCFLAFSFRKNLLYYVSSACNTMIVFEMQFWCFVLKVFFLFVFAVIILVDIIN